MSSTTWTTGAAGNQVTGRYPFPGGSVDVHINTAQPLPSDLFTLIADLFQAAGAVATELAERSAP